MPGTFNLSGYWSTLRNQQIQLGVACTPSKPNFTVSCGGNATILNAGKSRIWGIEADFSISPFRGLNLNASYGYINAKLLSITIPTVPGPYNDITAALTGPCGGELCNTIANSGPPHQVVLGANYTFPLPESVGKFSVGGTFVYQSRRRIVADGVVDRTNPAMPITSGAGVAPSSSVLNINVNWENVAQLPIDLSFFMTNVTNEVTVQQINENTTRGFLSEIYGEPRMWGFRLKYRFGGN
jgi:iron complex outermembrane receptor protein